MPLYYFHVYNDAVTMDEEGAELADVQAAQAYAVKAARSLAAETALHGYLDVTHYIHIEDEARQTIGKVAFGEAVEIREAQPFLKNTTA